MLASLAKRATSTAADEVSRLTATSRSSPSGGVYLQISTAAHCQPHRQCFPARTGCQQKSLSNEFTPQALPFAKEPEPIFLIVCSSEAGMKALPSHICLKVIACKKPGSPFQHLNFSISALQSPQAFGTKLRWGLRLASAFLALRSRWSLLSAELAVPFDLASAPDCFPSLLRPEPSDSCRVSAGNAMRRTRAAEHRNCPSEKRWRLRCRGDLMSPNLHTSEFVCQDWLARTKIDFPPRARCSFQLTKQRSERRSIPRAEEV